MGLNLQVNTQYDTSANYWHIAQTRQDFEAKALGVTLNGFVSQDARNSGATPIASRFVQFDGTSFIPDATRAALYDQIKTMPDFAGATDC